MTAIAQKTLTARLPESLHQATRRLASQRGESLNTLVEKALAREIREQEEKDLFDAFTLLGQDTEVTDVEYAAHAQAEVVLRG